MKTIEGLLANVRSRPFATYRWPAARLSRLSKFRAEQDRGEISAIAASHATIASHVSKIQGCSFRLRHDVGGLGDPNCSEASIPQTIRLLR